MNLILTGMYVLRESTRDSCISRVERDEVDLVLGLPSLCVWILFLVVLYSHIIWPFCWNSSNSFSFKGYIGRRQSRVTTSIFWLVLFWYVFNLCLCFERNEVQSLSCLQCPRSFVNLSICSLCWLPLADLRNSIQEVVVVWGEFSVCSQSPPVIPAA